MKAATNWRINAQQIKRKEKQKTKTTALELLKQTCCAIQTLGYS